MIWGLVQTEGRKVIGEANGKDGNRGGGHERGSNSRRKGESRVQVPIQRVPRLPQKLWTWTDGNRVWWSDERENMLVSMQEEDPGSRWGGGNVFREVTSTLEK